ncbi:MAG TPA: HAMP domain-containing histidine kinase [Candidatus Adamsella sp.]|nr:HAMP domain-containing histidine kinase [Candidatus Adamsella sp.]
MFKYTRYFLIIFVITMVIPIISIFMWTNHQLRKMEEKASQHFIEVGVTQLDEAIKQYQSIREGIILEKIQNMSPSQLNEAELKKVFDEDSLEFIYKNTDKITAGYEVINGKKNKKPEIHNVFVIPIKSPYTNLKGIKITEKSDFSELNIQGPFIIEVYAKDKIDKTSFIATVKDPFRPPSVLKKSFLSPPIPDNVRNTGIPTDPYNRYRIKKILDKNGDAVATFLLKTTIQTKHIGPLKFLENSFGLIIFFGAMALSLLIALYINRNFITPLMVLSEASKEVMKGNLDTHVSTNIKYAQIVRTFDNFNAMVKGLKEKEKLRNSFITSLTHDLRTPLIAQERCLTFISQKFKQMKLEEEYDLAKSLEKNNKHLLRMVNIILESYSFDSQNQQLSFSSINLSKIVDDCLEKLKPLLIDKNLEVTNSIPQNLPEITADAIALRRVFINLISNAVENLSQNDKIKINAVLSDSNLNITVEDNGPGIAKDDMEHIFEQYYTGKSIDRKLGSGLGLYVCKKLIELHNGKITVESKVGEYTKFNIQLPIQRNNTL